MDATAANLCEESATKYIGKLDNLVNAISASKRIVFNTFKIYYLLFDVLFKYEQIRRNFRSAIESCDATCEDRQKCAENLCENSTVIRNKLFELLERSYQHTILKPFQKSIENAVSDWDDFVEDCTIASDHKIKNLFDKIANAA